MSGRELFRQPESGRRSPLAALLSLVIHGGAAAGVVWVASMQGARPPIAPERTPIFLRVTLPKAPVDAIEPLRTVPPIETSAPEPPPEPKVIAELPALREPVVPEPPPRPTSVESSLPKRPAVTVGDFAAAPAPAPNVDRRQLQPVGFEVQQAIAPAVRTPRTDVGAFESREMKDPRPGSDRPAAVVVASAFDQAQRLSAAPRTGGTVAHSGFGSDSAAPPAAGRREAVQPAGFADAPVVPAATVRQRTEHSVTPLEVFFKPTPAYSPEALALKIEGTVTLEVAFAAAGQARVLRVVRGLGHGLDEMAIRAAEQIRFKPAQSAGKAVDVTANVQIVFRLT